MSEVRKITARAFFIFALILFADELPGETNAAQLHLTWTNNAQNADGFQIERRKEGEDEFKLIATTKADVTSYTDTEVSAEVTYCYRVRAFNATGESDYSGEVCGTPKEGSQPGRTPAARTAVKDPPGRSRPEPSSDPRQRPGRRRTADGWVQELPPAP